MNRTIFTAFAMGAVLGMIAAWRYSKRCVTCEAELEEPTQPDIHDVLEDETADISEMKQVIENEGYSDVIRNDPYVIFPEEFGIIPEYETISLTYYEDGTLADGDDHKIDDVENTVGEASLGRFGEYEDDTVYVRNERRKVDYEICRDVRTYEEVVQNLPFDY